MGAKRGGPSGVLDDLRRSGAETGIGSTLGLAGIRAFVQPKAWHLRTPRP